MMDFNRQDRIQILIAAICTVIAAVLCFTVLPSDMELMEGGKTKSNLYLLLLTLLPVLVTWVVAMSGKSRVISWMTLAIAEIYASVRVLGTMTSFSFDTDLLFHALFLILETVFAVHLRTIKDTKAKAAFRWQWIESDEGFMKAQKEGARIVTLLAVTEGINMLLSHFGLYSFTLSAGITIALCYVAFLLILRKVKHLS